MASEVPSVMWQYELNGEWEDYPANVSSALENIHNDGPHTSLVYQAENHETYEVDLLALTQKNVEWGTARKVRRFEVPIVVPFNESVFIWQYQQLDKTWADYPLELSLELEQKYSETSEEAEISSLIHVYKAGNDETYALDLFNLNQTNVDWGTQRDIRRINQNMLEQPNTVAIPEPVNISTHHPQHLAISHQAMTYQKPAAIMHQPEAAEQAMSEAEKGLWDALVKMNLQICYEIFNREGYLPAHFETLTNKDLREMGLKKGFFKRFRAIYADPSGTVSHKTPVEVENIPYKASVKTVAFQAPVHDSVEKNETTVMYKSSKPITRKQLEMKEVLELMRMSQFLEALFKHGFDDVTLCHHLTKKVQTEIGFGPGHKLKWSKEFPAPKPVVKQPKPQPAKLTPPTSPNVPATEKKKAVAQPTVPSAPVPTQPGEKKPPQPPQVVLPEEPAVLSPPPNAGVDVNDAEFVKFKMMLKIGLPPNSVHHKMLQSKLPESKVDAFLKAMGHENVVAQKKKPKKLLPPPAPKAKKAKFDVSHILDAVKNVTLKKPQKVKQQPIKAPEWNFPAAAHLPPPPQNEVDDIGDQDWDLD